MPLTNLRMNTVSKAPQLTPNITVIGVGGAGGNAVNNMITSNMIGVKFVVANTDAQALAGNMADTKIQLGTTLTSGLGAGAKPDIGRAAAQESLDDVIQQVDNANMVFITAGMGGGTGTGAAPVIAKACRERGILTVGVVTKPFHYEGTLRMKMAEDGIAEMQQYVDTLIVIPNQNLFRVVNDKTTFADAFRMADSVLQSAVRSVTDLIVLEGLINLDFADIRTVMQEMGKAVMGAGEASGERRATEAAEKAISNPLLDDISMKGAKGVIVNVTGGFDMTLFEVDEACNRIRDEVDPNANIIFGSTFDPNMEGKMRISVVATGIDAAAQSQTQRPRGYTSGLNVERKIMPQAPQAAPVAPVQNIVRPVVSAAPVYTPPVQQVAPQQQPNYYPQPQETVTVAQTAPSYAQFVQQVQAAEGQTAPRGMRYQGQFIPPEPVETQREPTPTFPPSYAQNYAHGNAAPQPTYEEQDAQEQVATAAPRKPSLFERITGGIRREIVAATHRDAEPDFSSGDAAQETYAAPKAPTAKRTAPPLPAQGRLNIDAPAAAAPKGEGDLDIPAFLRRQAN
jgi:cell division protein FtsZ